MPQKITGKVCAKNKISGHLSHFMYLNPYIVACQHGYSGTFEEWVNECVSLGEIDKFEIDSDGCLIGTYDESKLSFKIDGFGDLYVDRR